MNKSSPHCEAIGPSWYCARTQPKHEHIAARNLKARLGLEVFHPRLRVERSTQRGPVNVVEPLFPCYVFVRTNLQESFDQVRYCSGVSSLVRFGSEIPVVNDEVIEELRRCFESEEPMTVEERLEAGAEVTVNDGALLGSRAIVLRVLPSRQRVQILLDFLGRATLAEVDRQSLTVEGQRVTNMMPSLLAAPADFQISRAA